MKFIYDKNIICLFAVLGINPVLNAQTKQENYILTRELTEATKDVSPENIKTKARVEKITYFDGLGREKMRIVLPIEQKNAFLFPADSLDSAQTIGLATKVTYDGIGRIDQEYLPGVVHGINLPKTIVYDDYPEQRVYSQKRYENSPLNRIVRKGAPGIEWDVNGTHTLQYDYEINHNDDVLNFGVDYSLQNQNSSSDEAERIPLTLSAFYSDGKLFKTVAKDENNHTTIEFRNKEGQIILMRVQGKNKQLDTYYVYDIYANLVAILPPKLIELAKRSKNIAVYHPLIEKLGFQFRYDEKNRLIEKKLPGKGWKYMLYDKQNRLVAEQDENRHRLNEWIYTKYDRYGRIALTGIIKEDTGKSRHEIQQEINKLGNNNVSRDSYGFIHEGLKVYYNQAGFGADNTILTINYYDDYPMMKDGVDWKSKVFNQTLAIDDQLKGLPTLTIVRSLETKENNQSNFEFNYVFYENKELRAVKSHQINFLGGSTIVERDLDFRGKILETVTVHQRTQHDTPIKITEAFSYDDFERLILHTHQINDGKVELLTHNTYNDIGQLVGKSIGNTIESPNQEIDYAYNIRGWLVKINDIANLKNDLFAFKLNYNIKTETLMSDFTPELYNGNVAQTLWISQANSFLRSYDYRYDELNQLTDAYYSNISKNIIGAYDKKLTYDANGNILTLKRYGGSEKKTPTLIDDLVYTYENSGKSNQLQKVNDSSISEGFHDVNKGNDYAYDGNGNLVRDLNKGITQISYNYLDLPTEVVWNANKKINFFYNTKGQKLRKVVTNGQHITTTDYLNGFQYQNQVLQFLQTKEGFVENVNHHSKNDSIAFQYVYNLKDHLGNIRVSFTKDETTNQLRIIKENHYYPFGLIQKGYLASKQETEENSSNLASNQSTYQYQYQGQELQDDFDLEWYSFKWRNYMPEIGRFFNVDPLAEKYPYNGVYNFSENRVVDGRELEGLEWIRSTTESDEGVKTHVISATINVVNNATERTSNETLQKDFSQYRESLKEAYSGKTTSGDNLVVGEVNFQIVTEENIGNYSIKMVNNVTKDDQVLRASGITETIGNSQVNQIQVRPEGPADTKITTIHEIGHSLGLRHQNDYKNPIKENVEGDNLMHAPQLRGNKIVPEQRDIIIENIPSLK